MRMGLLFALSISVASLVAGSVRADPPIVGTSTVGTFVVLGTADDAGHLSAWLEKVVVVRDLGGVPVPGAAVEIRFGDCTSAGEFRLCEQQTFPGMMIACESRVVAVMSDAQGRATFRIRGHALNPGPAGPGLPGAGLGDSPCAQVWADGVWIGRLRVKACDQDGMNGVSPADLSLFLSDRFRSTCGHYPRADCATYRSRSDLNDDGRIDVADLSLFLHERFVPAPQRSCAGGGTCAP